MVASKEDWKANRAELAELLELERRLVDDAEAGRTSQANIEVSKRAVVVLKGVIAWIDKELGKP
ncbi:MAG: hypothetical protein EOQ34_25115 [Mesorhizobium sp.]|nr:MAG: hypothetical protein EOQ34_25115 [Mesorhizobium sp.]